MKESERLQQVKNSYLQSKKQVTGVLNLANDAISDLDNAINEDANAGNVDGNMFDNSYLTNLHEDEVNMRNSINDVIANIDSKINSLSDQIATAIDEEAAAEAAAMLGD